MPDETILSAIAGTGPCIYGLRWGDKTRFAVLDVDKNSRYRSELELAKLQERLAAVGLTATVYRSSDSGGWHVYIFFDDWAGSGEVKEHLSTWLRAQGYELRGGVLEVFPSGMGLRLPLQTGFAWLDSKGGLIRTREELTRDEALASFVADLEENKRNWSEAKDRIKRELEAVDRAKRSDAQAHEKAIDLDGLEGLFNYRLIPEKYQEGRRYWQTGLTGNGERHDAILAVEHYLWHGDEVAGVPALPAETNDEARYRLLLAWLEAKHNGFCNHINRGNWRKVEQQIRRACKWRRPFGAGQVRIPYLVTERSMERLIGLSKRDGRTWTPEDFKKANGGREERAREKIREALQLFTDQGRRITIRGLERVSGCHRDTIRRHSDIWKILPVVALSNGPGDQNPFLDLIAPSTPALSPDGSDPQSEKNFLNLPFDGDSGDLDLVREDLAEERGAQTVVVNEPPVLSAPGFGCWQWDLVGEGSSSCPSSVAPAAHPSSAASPAGCAAVPPPRSLDLVADSVSLELAPIQVGCLLPCADRQVATARESDGMETRGSLASPSSTQPSTESKHWLGGSGSTCGLNGFPPSCAEPPLGPPHLNPREIFSKGSGSVLLQDGGSRQSGLLAPAAVLALAADLFVSLHVIWRIIFPGFWRILFPLWNLVVCRQNPDYRSAPNIEFASDGSLCHAV